MVTAIWYQCPQNTHLVDLSFWKYVCVCVFWIFTDVYQLEIIIYVWERPLTSPSQKTLLRFKHGSIKHETRQLNTWPTHVTSALHVVSFQALKKDAANLKFLNLYFLHRKHLT